MATKRTCDYCGEEVLRRDVKIRCPEGYNGTTQFSMGLTYFKQQTTPCVPNAAWKPIDTCPACLIKLLQEALEKEDE